MNRVHLFELEDQAWFPRVLRDAGTAYLEFASRVAGHSAALAPKVLQALERSGEKRIVDLCSGGAGPVAEVVDVLAARGTEVHALLTDFYPNEGSLARVVREKSSQAGNGVAFVEVFENGHGLIKDETVLDQDRHLLPGIESGKFLGFEIPRRKREHFQLIGELFVFEAQPNPPSGR